MLSGRLGRVLKYTSLGVGVLGTGYVIRNNDWEMSTIGVVRFGRAAVTVG